MEHPKKLLALDILRGLACLLVWMSHLRVATAYFEASKYNFLQVFLAWGREAVVVFFVLSGLVINMATVNKTDRLEYFRKRFLRIYPIFLIVLIICYATDFFVFNDPIHFGYLIGNVFLLGMWPQFLVPTLPHDTAAWSVACEAFFYIVFGLAYTTNRRKAIWIWLTISFSSIVFSLFSDPHTGLIYQLLHLTNSSFPWLIGFLIYEYRDRFSASAQVAACGVLMIPLITRLTMLPGNYRQACYDIEGFYLVPLFVYILSRQQTKANRAATLNIRHIYFLPVYLLNVWLLWQYSDSLTISKALYSVVPVFSLVLYSSQVKNLLRMIYYRIRRLILFIAGISYPLYLIHMPVMYLVFHFIPGQKTLGMLLIVLITISVSYLFELYLFRKLLDFVKQRSKTP